MIKAGIGGGIGCGKSVISQCFKILGAAIYDADNMAKSLMNRTDIADKLIDKFGPDIYSYGKINKSRMTEIVFGDECGRKLVNKIVHPAVRDDFDNWANLQKSELVIIEAAIMFETGFYKHLDKTILVLADEEERILRLEKRDGLNRKMIKKRIDVQEKPENFINLATYLIHNNDKDEALPQVLNIYDKIMNHG